MSSAKTSKTQAAKPKAAKPSAPKAAKAPRASAAPKAAKAPRASAAPKATKTKYHEFILQLSDDQAKRLAHGENIRLKAEDISPSAGDVIFLTAQQVNRLRKAKAAGKGAELKLSDAQRSHQRKMGAGRFSDMLRGIGKAIRGAVQRVAPIVTRAARQTASQLLTEHGPELVQSAQQAIGAVGNRATRATASFLPDPMQDWVQQGVNLGQTWSGEQLQGLLDGLNRTVRGQEVLGAGLYLQGGLQV